MRKSFEPCLRGLVSVTAVLLVLLTAIPLSASDEGLITVEDQIWGFDGRVQVGQFNPVSVLIDNRMKQAIDVEASLYRERGMEGLVGNTSGFQIQPVFIGPGDRQWVRFYVYIPTDEQCDWQLELGDWIHQRFQQPQATTTLWDGNKQEDPGKVKPVAVILDRRGAMSREPTSVEHFPEFIFPPYATATVGLHTIFMDHVPDWDVPQQQALMSWLRSGGRLCLLKDNTARWPEFRGELSGLNRPLDDFHVGAGTVRRLEMQRSGLSAGLVKELLSPLEDADPLEDLTDDEIAETLNPYSNKYSASVLDVNRQDEIWFEQMRQLTQPKHAWWLIMLLALAYIGLIFPGCWILAKQKRHFLVVYGSIAGLSIIFSLLFLIIGRRGHGETTSLHTLALSRLQNNGQQSVMGWNALFVTVGDNYSITSHDAQMLTGIPGTRQATSAEMRTGNKAELQIGIPPFSSQTFVDRRQMPAPDWKLRVSELHSADKRNLRLTIQADGKSRFSKDARFRVLYQNYLHRAVQDEQQQTLTITGTEESLARFCHNHQKKLDGYGWSWRHTTGPENFFIQAENGLLLRSLMEDAGGDPMRFSLPPDRVRLFVYTSIPEDQFLQVDASRKTDGRILYVCDLPIDP